MFSTVGSWISAGVDAVAEKVGADMKLDDQYNDDGDVKKPTTPPPAGAERSVAEGSASEKKAEATTSSGTDASGLDLPVWEEPPAALVPHRDEWRTLILGLMQDENSFIISMSRLQQEQEGASWAKVVQILDLQQKSDCSSGADFWEGEIRNAELNRKMEAKIHRIQEMLVADRLPDLNKLRYKTSPHFVSDTQFWANFQFRLCLLHQCTSLESLLNLLEPLNTEPTPQRDPSVQRKKNVGTAENAAVLQQIRDAINAKTIQAGWVAKKKEIALESLQAGRNSCSMLHSLLVQKESTESAELVESVAESCKYHKTKLGGLIGELSAPGTPEKLQSSGLEAEGIIMEQLLTLNEDLHQELESYATRTPGRPNAAPTSTASAMTASQGSTAVSPAPGGEDPVASPSATVAGGATKRAESTSSVATPTTSGSPAAAVAVVVGGDDNAFNAALPWDDDDD